MTTLADMALRVAGVITDVLSSQATAGTASTIVDDLSLTQKNQYWHKGTVWIRSGAHIGKVFPVDGFASRTITIPATLDPVLESTVRYSVTRGLYPWSQLVRSINDALEECIILDDDATLIGDGVTLEFDLPVGVERVSYVEIENTQGERTAKNHWRPHDGVIRFDYGYAPQDGWTIHLMHKITHPSIYLYSDEIRNEVSLEWLRWKAAEYSLYWGVGMYGDASEYRIEEYLNRAMTKLKGLMPVKPKVTMRSA